MKNILLLFILCITCSAHAQESGLNYKYSFKEFCINKTDGYKFVLKQIYSNMRYHPIARENEIEGSVILSIQHSRSNGLDVYCKSSEGHRLLCEYAIQDLTNIFSDIDYDKTENFLTSLEVIYDSIDTEKKIAAKTKEPIILKAIKPTILHSHSP